MSALLSTLGVFFARVLGWSGRSTRNTPATWDGLDAVLKQSSASPAELRAASTHPTRARSRLRRVPWESASSRTMSALLSTLGAFFAFFATFAFASTAHADVAMRMSNLPLSKTFDQPFFSLDGSHVELFSLLFLFMAAALVMTVKRHRQVIRHIVQLVSIILFFYVVYSCLGVFGMIRNTIYGISLIGTVYTESFFWMSLPVAILAFTLASGPFFCGWICPTGTIQEWIAIVREWVTRRSSLELNKYTWPLAISFAGGFLYIVLQESSARELFIEDSSLYWASASIALPLLVLSGVASDSAIRDIRWLSLGSIVLSTILKVMIISPVHFAFVDVVDPGSLITTLVLAVASIFVSRSWCRYLCPWGKLMGLLHRHSRLAFEISDSCTQCHACLPHCRVGAIRDGRIDHDSCQFCFACIDACPSGAIEVVDRWKKETEDVEELEELEELEDEVVA